MKLVNNHDQNLSYEMLLGKCKEAFNNKAPLNPEYLRSNHNPLTNKNIFRVIYGLHRIKKVLKC